MVATGGFGRGEMAPLSDIDLLFLRPYKQTPRGEQIVEFMLYLLWDLGLKVGHATRTVDESLRYAERDQTIRTALLEARYIWGDRELFDELTKGFAAEVRCAATAATSSRPSSPSATSATQRMGDSRYVVEPNVKEGKGGLRDLHTLFWIAKYLYRVDEPAELVDQGRADPGRGAPLRARRALPLDGALPPPLSDRPRRRPAVLRPPARDRRAPGLPGPAGQPRRRALHEALLSSSPRRSAT